MGDKAQAELTVAPALLAQIDWTGRVLTGDALQGNRKNGRRCVAWVSALLTWTCTSHNAEDSQPKTRGHMGILTRRIFP